MILLTEDSRAQGIEAILEASGFDLAETTILPYNGATAIQNLRPLIRVIQSSNPKAKIIVHRDRDYLVDSEAQEWERKVRALKAEPFVTAGLDVEAHFLDPNHLAQLNPQCGKEEFGVLLADAMNDIHDELLASYVNGRVAIERNAGNAAKINHGQIAAEAQAALKKKPERWSKGKALLKRLRAKFQTQYSENLRVYIASPNVKDASLEVVAKKVFGIGK